MTDLVERLRNWPCIYPEDLYEPEGYLYEVAADRIEALEAKLRKSALQELSALGQAEDAYQAQLAVEAKLEAAVAALDHLGFDWESRVGRQIKEKSDG